MCCACGASVRMLILTMYCIGVQDQSAPPWQLSVSMCRMHRLLLMMVRAESCCSVCHPQAVEPRCGTWARLNKALPFCLLLWQQQRSMLTCSFGQQGGWRQSSAGSRSPKGTQVKVTRCRRVNHAMVGVLEALRPRVRHPPPKRAPLPAVHKGLDALAFASASHAFHHARQLFRTPVVPSRWLALRVHVWNG